MYMIHTCFLRTHAHRNRCVFLDSFGRTAFLRFVLSIATGHFPDIPGFRLLAMKKANLPKQLVQTDGVGVVLGEVRA